MLPQHGTLTLSRSRLRHNLALLRARIGPHPRFCATIKANAYGHGTPELANMLHAQGLDWACVYSVEEALQLRHTGFNLLALSPVVLTGTYNAFPNAHLLADAHTRIRLNVTDVTTARLLSEALQRTVHNPQRRLPIHIQVDAGLTRVGIDPDDAEALANAIAALPGLRLEGLFAHFSHGDVPRHGTLEQQLALLHRVAHPLRNAFPGLLVHLQNSGGSWNTDPDHLDMVRVGIAMYGLQPSTSDPIPGLLPIAELSAPILAIHERPPGTGVGYGHTFTTHRHSRLAIAPVGYADGYPRQLSNTPHAVAQLRGRTVPIVGRVSMDQVILDITDLPDAAPGDRVTLISANPGDPNCLDAMADAIGTIGYELATHFGHRLQRTIID